MKKTTKLTYLLIGAILAITVMNFALPAFAALAEKAITVYTGVSIFVDDRIIETKDANGKTVEAFIHNGTTYLPVRAISKVFGKPIEWDGKTQSVYIGKHRNSEGVFLSSLDKFYGGYYDTPDEVYTDNVENKYQNVLNLKQCIYLLNGQYSSISGVFYLARPYRNYDSKETLTIKGDDRILYSAEMGAKMEPKEFDVDLTGVLKLEITIDHVSGLVETSYLGDVRIYP